MTTRNQRIREFAESVHTFGPERDARIAELVDHLHCQMERLMSEGLAEEQALEQALASVGDVQELAQEELRSEGWLAHVMGVLAGLLTFNSKKLQRHLSARSAAVWIIAVALFCALGMTVTAWITKSDHQTWTYLWIAVWWVPNTLLSTVAAQLGSKPKCQRT